MAKDTFSVSLRSQHFECQFGALAGHSHYFEALSSWPGVESSSRTVKLPSTFDPKSFAYIYAVMAGEDRVLPEEDTKDVLELCDYLQVTDTFLGKVLGCVQVSSEYLLAWIELSSKRTTDAWKAFTCKLWKNCQQHLDEILDDEAFAKLSAKSIVGILDCEGIKALSKERINTVLQLAKSKTQFNSWFQLISLVRDAAEADFETWSNSSPPSFVWELGGLEYGKLRSHEYFKKSFTCEDSHWSLKTRMTIDHQFIGLFVSLDVSSWKCDFNTLSYKYRIGQECKQAMLAFPKLWRSSYGPARCIAAPLKPNTCVEVWVRTSPLHSLLLEQVSAELISSVMQARPKEMLSFHMRDVFSLLEQSPSPSPDELLVFLAKFLLEHPHDSSDGLVRCLSWPEASSAALLKVMQIDDYSQLPECFREALEIEYSSRELPSSLRLF